MSGWWWWWGLGLFGFFGVVFLGLLFWFMVKAVMAYFHWALGNPKRRKSRPRHQGQEPIVIIDDVANLMLPSLYPLGPRLEISVSIGGDNSLNEAMALVRTLQEISQASQQRP